jgi:hypothetical protein
VSTKISKNSPSGIICAHHVALGTEGRDERGDDDQARIGHQLRDLADAADIFDAVGVGKAQILVEAVADIVAIEQEGVRFRRVQLLLDQVGDGRFARARKAGEPQHRRLLALLEAACASRLMSIACQWTFCARRSEK